MKKIKYVTLLSACLLTVSTVSPITVLANTDTSMIMSSTYLDSNIFVNYDGEVYAQGQLLEADKTEMINSGELLSELFYIDNYGNIRLSATAEEISELIGVSLSEAKAMIEATKELPNVYSRGFVGLRIHLGPTVRAMGGWAAGTYATAYCAWHLKQFAVSASTAGAVAVISGGIGWAVKTAVEYGWRMTTVGTNIPGVAMSFDVYVP